MIRARKLSNICLLALVSPLIGLLGVDLSEGTAYASPYSEVSSALDKGDRFDLHSSVSYEFSSRKSSIKREFIGFPGTKLGDPVPIVRDLLSQSSQHLVVPALELGVFHDLWLSASLPIVIHQSQTLSFDQSSTPCVFPEGNETATCINANNSSTIIDGLLPPTGFDSGDPTGPGFSDSSNNTIFRAPHRNGTTQLYLGIGYAPMNQERDPSKPTWKINAQLRLPIGSIKKFKRSALRSSTGVSEGITHLHLSTSMAKKTNWAEPHVEFWWQIPLSVKSNAPLAPLAKGYGVSSESPPQKAGANFGVEATVWKKPEDGLKVGLDFSANFTATFEGRGYSDMWQVFQFAGDKDEPTSTLVLDEDPTLPGVQAKSHPGVSNIENFMSLDFNLRVTAEIGESVRFSAGVGYRHEQSHLISFADSGRDLPTCTGAITSSCESNNNKLVNPNTKEVNPLYSPGVDQSGHRYRLDDANTLLFTINARMLF